MSQELYPLWAFGDGRTIVITRGRQQSIDMLKSYRETGKFNWADIRPEHVLEE